MELYGYERLLSPASTVSAEEERGKVYIIYIYARERMKAESGGAEGGLLVSLFGN